MFKILSLFIALTFSGYLMAEPVADLHTEMAGCESCHDNGEPSADLVFENATCIDCHGDLNELSGEDHKLHIDILQCSDCHIVHDVAPAESTCVNCH